MKPQRSGTRRSLTLLALLQCVSVSGTEAVATQKVALRNQSQDQDGSHPQEFPALPLSTAGRYIVDARNQRFKLKSVNWYGPHVAVQVAHGLDHQPIAHIVQLIKDWGFNSVRLPFSNMMLHDARPVAEAAVRANPQLIGLTPLQVFDETVRALTDAGILVILNNHTTISEWCCGYDYNGLWHHTGSRLAYNQTTEMWQSDWLMLIERYRNNPRVVGADLRNEVRTMRLGDTHLPKAPNWGSGNGDDWNRVAEELGNRILKVNPDVLIIVEGINWWGTIPVLGSGERPHLQPIRDLPIHLQSPRKLVYAAHNYAFIGPNHTGDSRNSRGNITYGDMDATQFHATMIKEWAYVLEPEQYYTAPVWISEFGVAHSDASDADRKWLSRMVDFMIEHDVDFAYWPLNSERFGLVTEDWSRARTDDWRHEHLRRLLDAKGREGPVQAVHFSVLSLEKADDNQSSLDIDWLPGARKGACPDGHRLLGVSRNQRALCGNLTYQNLWQEQRFVVQAVDETRERHHATGDWASGFTKYECPPNHYAAGLTKHHWGSSGLLCAESTRPLGNACRTSWFDRGDQRASEAGGDWARNAYKGQCADHEYLAGLAQRDGKASALLCCSVD
jgi:aryl-phospho-beta-D-glucosidase BglC (GH1 family)